MPVNTNKCNVQLVEESFVYNLTDQLNCEPLNSVSVQILNRGGVVISFFSLALLMESRQCRDDV